ncbi:hypothetical protein F5Y10DRAFT_260068 [Nemania abortiva]|nr:hypothetical protein F5Y10DRAFT_260068 [Nemania abortiva]
MEDLAGCGPLVHVLAGLVVIYLVAGDLPGLGSRYRKLPEAPVARVRFPFELRWVTRCMFYSSGWNINKKDCETTNIFKVPSGLSTVVRPDFNITIIPRKYVDEIASLMNGRPAANGAILNAGVPALAVCFGMLIALG